MKIYCVVCEKEIGHSQKTISLIQHDNFFISDDVYTEKEQLIWLNFYASKQNFKQKIKVVDVKNVKDSLETIFLRLTSNKKGGK